MTVNVVISNPTPDEALALNQMLEGLNRALEAAGESPVANMQDKFARDIEAEIANHVSSMQSQRVAALAPLGKALALLNVENQRTVIQSLIDATSAAGSDTSALVAYRDSLVET